MNRDPSVSGLVEKRVVATLRDARYLPPEGQAGLSPGIRNMAEMSVLAFVGLGSVWTYLADVGPIGKVVVVASIVIAPLFRLWVWPDNRGAQRPPAWTHVAEPTARVDQPGRGAGFDPDAVIDRYMAGRDAAEPPPPVTPAPHRPLGRGKT